jgi:CheY-like chemotaxis protein
LHFNKSIKNKDWNGSFDNRLETYDKNNVIAIDTLRVDDHSRLTLTKRFRNIFPIESGDVIAVYQDVETNNLILEVQHADNKVDPWIVKRTDIDNNNLISTNERTVADTSSPIFNNGTRQNEQQKRSINVMVVDDEPDMLLIFKTLLLTSKGYNVKTFEDSQEALKHFTEVNRRPHYDIVISDIRMPKPNGIQLYPLLKEVDPNIKVLFVSALDAAEELTSLFPDLGSSIIKKPLDEEPLLSAIKKVLNRKSNA